MEDVLEVYKRPYDPLTPVVCLDETNRQLIEETRTSIETKPGQVKRVDYEYKRNGVANLFMMFVPLEAKRFVVEEESCSLIFGDNLYLHFCVTLW